MTRLSGKLHRDLAVLTLIPFPCSTNTGEETITSTMGNKAKECDFSLDKLKGLVLHPSLPTVSFPPAYVKRMLGAKKEIPHKHPYLPLRPEQSCHRH